MELNCLPSELKKSVNVFFNEGKREIKKGRGREGEDIN